ncbi:hypothetical protein RvY_16611 [Ramazzottius varieornatus]|uniref:Uncharacterized protein n=1 Tax=Ramazzottius varieornatus TaxID=947166 RepID=A0A1D1VZ38_RAMVA|nr:hypothetical protein RvY_16611 [Ramazzottius varieornatus]
MKWGKEIGKESGSRVSRKSKRAETREIVTKKSVSDAIVFIRKMNKENNKIVGGRDGNDLTKYRKWRTARLDEPNLLKAWTAPRLSHWKDICRLVKGEHNKEQANTIGISSRSSILKEEERTQLGQRRLNHSPSKYPPQPRVALALVKRLMVEECNHKGRINEEVPFHKGRNLIHHSTSRCTSGTRLK